MRLDFNSFTNAATVGTIWPDMTCHATSETDALTDVVLCAPHHLAPVPCCAVTRQHLGKGHRTSTAVALAQHEALVAKLRRHGVRCHMLPPAPGLPDMCFTRDIAVATPFGLVALNPAMPHRKGEIELLLRATELWSLPCSRITQGTLEGGDICLAREGLLLVGLSGERSSAAGVEEFCTPFLACGWEVILCPFHADHLHLDTIFCMLAPEEAIGCIDYLDKAFIQAVQDRGIRIIAASPNAVATLGCNILSLGDGRIIASAQAIEVAATLRNEGYEVETVDVSEFAACGGGLHCLTQPLRRTSNAR